LEIDFEKLGSVTEEKISIDGENWGSINDWKTKYDNAIAELIKEN